MYILDYLGGKYSGPASREDRTAEYRLLCSGELYNSRVLTLDWRKSDVTRNLLRKPCSLTVISQPFDDYPQELSLVITVPVIQEKSGNSMSTFHPDDDIAEDLAALLTLFLRRLVTLCVKVRTKYVTDTTDTPIESSQFRDWSLPIANAMNKVAWKRRGVSIGYSVQGTTVIDHSPPPVQVDPQRLESKFVSVATIKYGESYVMAARLYAQAMRMIEEWPDIAYQLLVYSAETIANKVLSDYSPSPQEKVEVKGGVARRAQELGLTRENAEELAVLACADMPWASRKFRKFLKEMTDKSLWEPDELFSIHEVYKPSAQDLDQALKRIYESRSAVVHEGEGYGPAVGLGTAPMIPVGALQELLSGGPKVPPVTWFERVVNIALNRYLDAASREKI